MSSSILFLFCPMNLKNQQQQPKYELNRKYLCLFQGVMETVIGLGMSVGPAIGGVLYSVSFTFNHYLS